MCLHQLCKNFRRRQVNDLPHFYPGDIVCIGMIIHKRRKRRSQVYQGTMISQ